MATLYSHASAELDDIWWGPQDEHDDGSGDDDDDVDDEAAASEAEEHVSAGVDDKQLPDGGAAGVLPGKEAVEPPVEETASSEKGKQVARTEKQRGVDNILDLPLDILRLIVKEVTHTNDLTSLAATNSAFHCLAVPHIYARFDIVWPEAPAEASDNKSVDALTYGLSTLCLNNSFAQRTQRLRAAAAAAPGGSSRPVRPLLRNHARHTRKFSLGNGPSEWVLEYLIWKEAGKMLGTLVALAVEKMVNLETFVWDMPTGVLSDVFLALGSLQDGRADDDPCKLERVWVRWHDSTLLTSHGDARHNTHLPPMGSLTTIGYLLQPRRVPESQRYAFRDSKVEYPTFSILPPLKSLSVLDVDDPSYLDEMAVLVKRSLGSLRELRVGISSRVVDRSFVQIWDGPDLEQVDHGASWPGENKIHYERLGGVLGILVGHVYDLRREVRRSPEVKASKASASASASAAASSSTAPAASSDTVAQETESPEIVPGAGESGETQPGGSKADAEKGCSNSSSKESSTEHAGARKRLDGKLRLHALELERVPISIQACTRALDWTVLTRLTLLDCPQSENLWRALRRQFQPVHADVPAERHQGTPRYQLSLRKIHTDSPSLHLVNFIKETLAPNTLEVLFLQDRRRSQSTPALALEAIFQGAIRKHRSSLRKLLLDSGAMGEAAAAAAADGSLPRNTRWKNWMLTTNVLEYMTSGRMSNLREVAVYISYRNWHLFLQRLPNLPQLRSLNIYGLGHYHSGTFDSRELALQVLDIVCLRPEIRLCYVGVGNKCFEVQETNPAEQRGRGSGSLLAEGVGGVVGGGGGALFVGDAGAAAGNDAADSVDGSDDEGNESGSNDSDDDESDGTTTESGGVPDDAVSVFSGSEGSAVDDYYALGGQPKLRLREILFYDDKVEIFKARHGKL